MVRAFAGERSPAMVRNADGVGDVKPQWVYGQPGCCLGLGAAVRPLLGAPACLPCLPCLHWTAPGPGQ